MNGTVARSVDRAGRGGRVGPVAWLLVWPIRAYQLGISRFTPPTCRYYPCCSSYAIGALRTHGAGKGLLLSVWRLLRCHPWAAGGVDLVPDRGSWRGSSGEYDDERGRASVDHEPSAVGTNENGVIPTCFDPSARVGAGAGPMGSVAEPGTSTAGRTAA